MAIIPSEPLELSQRDELIVTVADMIDDAVTSTVAVCPFELAAKIVDEMLSMQESTTAVLTEGAPPAVVDGVGKRVSTDRSSAGSNVVWLRENDTSER